MPNPRSSRRWSTAVMASSQWLAHFFANRGGLLDVPWAEAPLITPGERDAIAASIAEFQLGESSEGRHLSLYATLYSRSTGDSEYAPAVGLFIAEEWRHARDLGRFMDLAGIPRKRRTFADRVFRSLRRLARLELAVSVLLTAEIIAQVYYRALRDATRSRALRVLCTQILRDERAHVQFQAERLAILRYRRSSMALVMRELLHRALMAGTILVVWHNHARALKQGGYTFRRFRRQTWIHTERALRIASPGRYRWPTPVRAMAASLRA